MYFIVPQSLYTCSIVGSDVTADDPTLAAARSSLFSPLRKGGTILLDLASYWTPCPYSSSVQTVKRVRIARREYSLDTRSFPQPREARLSEKSERNATFR